MNKGELIAAIAEKTGGTKAGATDMVNAVVEIVTEELARGGEIALAGLGVFKTSKRAARTGKNPKTGEALTIPATVVAKFSAAKALKDAVKAPKKRGK